MATYEENIQLNEFGQIELTAKEQKDLFFADLRLYKNLLRTKYMNVRNTAPAGSSPVIEQDMTAREAYDALIADYPQLRGDVALVAMAHLRKEYKENK